jgi:hypothetical protein
VATAKSEIDGRGVAIPPASSGAVDHYPGRCALLTYLQQQLGNRKPGPMAGDQFGQAISARPGGSGRRRPPDPPCGWRHRRVAGSGVAPGEGRLEKPTAEAVG